MSWWAGLDPGRCKCGLVLVDLERNFVREGRIVPPDAVHGVIHDWHRTFRLSGIVVGDGTTSRRWLQELSNLAPVHEVVERGSTLQARQRYWELWPPRGWTPKKREARGAPTLAVGLLPFGAAGLVDTPAGLGFAHFKATWRC